MCLLQILCPQRSVSKLHVLHPSKNSTRYYIAVERTSKYNNKKIVVRSPLQVRTYVHASKSNFIYLYIYLGPWSFIVIKCAIRSQFHSLITEYIFSSYFQSQDKQLTNLEVDIKITSLSVI